MTRLVLILLLLFTGCQSSEPKPPVVSGCCVNKLDDNGMKSLQVKWQQKYKLEVKDGPN